MTLTTPTSRFDQLGNLKALVETDEADVLRKPCGALHYSPNYMGNLMVVHRRSVRDDDGAEAVYLSADGRAWINEWHRGETGACDHEIYVEIHGALGCCFHGWINSITRRLVQAG